MKKQIILLVDDDPLIQIIIGKTLYASNYQAIIAEDGKSALEAIGKYDPDLVILDLMLPDIDGDEVCRRIRKCSQVPVIVLSAKATEIDKVELLELGADDYLTKPFGMAELLARIRAALRRLPDSDPDHRMGSTVVGDILIDFSARRVTVRDDEIHLTPIEYDLLSELVVNVDKVLTHQQLLRQIWGGGLPGQNALLREYIRRLRNKVELDPRNPEYVMTEVGVGYYMKNKRTKAKISN